MNIVIVGGGKKIDFLVHTLLDKNKKHHIVVINEDEKQCKEMVRNFGMQGHDIQVVNGYGGKPFILEDAGIRGADLIITLTPKDSDNLIICQLAKRLFNIKRAFATVNNPKNVDVFKQLGISTAVSATRVLADIIQQMAEVHEVVNYLPLLEGKLQLITLTIAAEHSACGQKIIDLRLSNYGAMINALVRNDKITIPCANTADEEIIIQEGDKLLITTTLESKESILNALLGGLK